MKYSLAEIIAGFFVIAVAVVFGVILFRSGNHVDIGESYALKAEFVSAEGIRKGGEVRMAGVKIGEVSAMKLDTENYLADVELLISNSVKIPTDSEVKVASEGLLGGKYVEVVPGADIVMLENGEQFTYASGSVSLIGLFSSFIGSNAKEDSP